MELLKFAEWFSVIMEVVALNYFYLLLFKKKKISDLSYWLYYAVIFCLALYTTSCVDTVIYRTILYIAIDTLPILLYKGKLILKLFAALLIFAIQNIAEILVWSILATLYQVMHLGLTDISQGVYGPEMYLQGVLYSKFLTLFIIKILSNMKANSVVETIPSRIGLFFILPIATIIVIFQLTYAAAITSHTIMAYSFVFTSILLLAANIVFFYLFDRQIEMEQLRYQTAMNKMNLDNQRMLYKALQKEERQINKVLHDLKHQVILLEHYWAEGNDEQAKHILKNLSGGLHQRKIKITGNGEIDALLYVKQLEAEEIGVSIQVTNMFEADFKVEMLDLITILGNCLDNALEAVAKIDSNVTERYIKLVLRTTCNEIFVQVENSITSAVKVDTKGFIKTTKKNKRHHGLGLETVKELVEKYDGHVNIDSAEKTFTIMMMMQNTSVN